MIYSDRILGEVTIDEPVIRDLLQSKPIQRLKKVTMAGFSVFLAENHPLMRFNPWFTRFEHSVGVYLLLRRYGATLEEQVAGLLHDVSHTAFSHIVDHVFGREMQHDYHEHIFQEVLLSSEIPDILGKYGLDISYIIDLGRFGLLEREIPDICVDRIDYFTRSMLDTIITRRWILERLEDITVFNDRLVFKNIRGARSFAHKYLEANEILYCNALQATIYYKIAEILRLALEKGVIGEKDFLSDDFTLYNKLCSDKELRDLIKLLNKVRIVEDNENYDLWVKSKVRYVDPHILVDNKLFRLSEIDSNFREKLGKFIKHRSQGFKVRVIYSGNSGSSPRCI